MWFSCAFLKTYGNPVPFPLGAHCTYILPCNALMSLRAKRGNLPEGEPCKTNAVLLSKSNINEKFFSGKKDFVREKY